MELEALRGDIDGAAKKSLPAANGVPKPTIVPPLESFSEHSPYPEPANSAPLSNGFDRRLPSNVQPPHTAAIPSQKGSSPGFIPHKIPNVPSNSFYSQSPAPSPYPQTPTTPDRFAQTSAGLSSSTTQSLQRHPTLPPQSPVAGPSSPAIHSPVPKTAPDVPPLGGRFVDGTKSMFVSRPTSSPRPSSLAGSASVTSLPGPLTSSGGPIDPLRNTKYHGVPSTIQDPLGQGFFETPSQEIDPLASVNSHRMASSMRVQPIRPRLDAREAASKLANMF